MRGLGERARESCKALSRWHKYFHFLCHPSFLSFSILLTFPQRCIRALNHTHTRTHLYACIWWEAAGKKTWWSWCWMFTVSAARTHTHTHTFYYHGGDFLQCCLAPKPNFYRNLFLQFILRSVFKFCYYLPFPHIVLKLYWTQKWNCSFQCNLFLVLYIRMYVSYLYIIVWIWMY